MNTFTLDQLYLYYAAVQVEKGKEERIRATAIGNAVGFGFGGMTASEFNSFLDSLYKPKTLDENDSFEQMKSMGLPVEDSNE